MKGRSVLVLLAAATVMLSGSVAFGQYYPVPTTVYSPVIAPAPVAVYSPVVPVAPVPVTVYHPAPVTVYSPVVAPAPVAVYRRPATVYYRPEIRVPGQPVRNLLRAIVP